MYKDLIHDLRRYGLTNGTALGRHMGIMDEAADAIETLTLELAAEKKRAGAAVKDITHICHTCKHAYANRGEHCRSAHYEKNNLRCKNWKWRGGQGTEGER